MTDKAHISPYMYYVMVDIDPVRGADYLNWLNTKQIGDVVNTPWVLWARKVALEQKAEDGWDKIMIVYGFPSQKEYLEYRKSDVFKKLAEELKPFKGVYRVTRFYGQIDLVLDG